MIARTIIEMQPVIKQYLISMLQRMKLKNRKRREREVRL